MKLQYLAVLFILIILPLSIVLSEYLQTHITTLQLQNLYNTRLMSATHDAAQSFELNTANNNYSTGQDSKRRDVEAAIETFYNTLALGMQTEGYTADDLHLYTPAVLCTLYDGYYIYTKYNDRMYAVGDYYDGTENRNAEDSNGDNLTDDHYVYGLKPFITYSCRYVKGADDFVVNYTLDNSITIIGKVGGSFCTKSGHLVADTGLGTTLHGAHESLSEYLIIINSDNSYESQQMVGGFLIPVPEEFEYVVYNNQKIYRNYAINSSTDYTASPFYEKQYFYYGSDYKKVFVNNPDDIANIEKHFNTGEEDGNYAYKYYDDNFTNWVITNLQTITQADAVDSDSNPIFNDDTIYSGLTDPIFKVDANNDPLASDSTFNEHRMNVIKYSVSTNLRNVMNVFGNTGYDEFRMPNLSEEEWYNISNNVTFVSFLQNMPIKSKLYNNYCVVANNTNNETVNTDSIYLIDNNNIYHKPGCKALIRDLMGYSKSLTAAYSAADFEKRRISLDGTDINSISSAEDGSRAFFYPHTGCTACYDCIINAANINNVDNIIKETGIVEYVDSSGNTQTVLSTAVPGGGGLNLRTFYLRALARERYNLYTLNGYFEF